MIRLRRCSADDIIRAREFMKKTREWQGMSAEKKLQMMILFPTTTQALKMEDCCRTGKMLGRLIPVPGQVRAGCGMGWIAGPERRREFEKFMGEQGICWEDIRELYL